MIRGLVYPLEINAQGDLAVTANYPKLVQQAIMHCLRTIRGELVWYPEHGRGYLVFDTVQDIPAMLAELRLVIQDGLSGYPGVTYQLLAGFTDESNLNLVVNYQCPDIEPAKLELTITLGTNS